MPLLDQEELAAIRTDLYSLKALIDIYPDNKTKLNEFYKESIRHLTEYEEGVCVCDFLRDNSARESLESRVRDIALTYYTLSRLTHTEDLILNLLTEEQRRTAATLKETLEGHIFHSLAACCDTRSKELALERYEEVICGVSTKEITEQYNFSQSDEQNQRSSMEGITCNKITRTLKDMGFDIDRKTGNRSYITWTEGTQRALSVNLEKFGSEDDHKIFTTLKKTRSKTKVNLEINSKSKINYDLTDAPRC